MNMKDVKLSDIKVLMVKKSSPKKLFCKYSYMNLDFTEVTIIKNKNKLHITELVLYYSEKISPNSKKKVDMQKFVERKFIPQSHKGFFENL